MPARVMQRDAHDGLGQVVEKMRRLGNLVATMVDQAVTSLVERAPRLAEEAITCDDTVDVLEREVREDCVRLLAEGQSARKDVRFIAAAIKISTDLERMGDEAANISLLAVRLNEESQIAPLIDIPSMSQLSQKMLLSCLDAFVREDVAMARKVIAAHRDVQDLKDQVFRVLLTVMMGDPQNLPRAILLIQVSHHLERIAEYATTISEMVVFLAEGRGVRPMAQSEP